MPAILLQYFADTHAMQRYPHFQDFNFVKSRSIVIRTTMSSPCIPRWNNKRSNSFEFKWAAFQRVAHQRPQVCTESLSFWYLILEFVKSWRCNNFCKCFLDFVISVTLRRPRPSGSKNTMPVRGVWYSKQKCPTSLFGLWSLKNIRIPDSGFGNNCFSVYPPMSS